MTHSIAKATLDKQQTRRQCPASTVLIFEMSTSRLARSMVLDGINLTVVRGETLAVLGRSGTGKSVLLKLIIGLNIRTPVRYVSKGKRLQVSASMR